MEKHQIQSKSDVHEQIHHTDEEEEEDTATLGHLERWGRGGRRDSREEAVRGGVETPNGEDNMAGRGSRGRARRWGWHGVRGRGGGYGRGEGGRENDVGQASQGS